MFNIDRNGTPIYYDYRRSEADTEEVVILLHGNGVDSQSWFQITDGLAENYHLLLPDFPGYGRSPSQTKLPSWEELCEDLIALTRYLGLERYHLIGHDLGGNLAVIFANRFPHLVRTVCLISTPCFFPVEETRTYIQFRKNLVQKFGKEKLISHVLPNITLHNHTAQAWGVVYSGLRACSLDMHFHCCHLVVDTDWISELKRLSMPALVMSGENDSLFTPYSSLVASGFIPRSEYVNILDASNMVFIDQPQETLRHIRRFLTKSDGFAAESSDELKQMHKKMKERFAQSPFPHPAPVLTMKLLGQFSIRLNELPMEYGWNQRFAKTLILYLTFYRKVSRDQLLDDLWPDKNLLSAQNQLRVSLNYLKTLFSQHGCSSIITSDREYIALEADVHCDIYELYRVLMNDRIEENRDRLEDALFRYAEVIRSHHYLIGYSDDWSVRLKEQIAARMQLSAERLSRYYEQLGDRSMSAAFQQMI
ncbi:alpha/beta fold hydrolase [Paenibacillus doosanensis]|uniref:alpha/beta hydrolase n=1 Tax=Paenibacillus doosanensis TaxID=1229154 RepID=UPI0021809AAA|nr:alpha/beta hydrolase [Paenibacillus doosanensis]MCS7462846.1 alpha/beta fold hydrolase [Paenibacillus doosanensis]